MKKYFLILLLAVILAGCEGKKVIIDNTTEQPNNLIVSGIETKGNCYLSEKLVCISFSASDTELTIQIKNLFEETLHSAYITASQCKSDKIDVESQKIVTYILHNCPDANEIEEFNIIYEDGNMESFSFKGKKNPS